MIHCSFITLSKNTEKTNWNLLVLFAVSPFFALNILIIWYERKQKTGRHKLLPAWSMSAKMAANGIRTHARTKQIMRCAYALMLAFRVM